MIRKIIAWGSAALLLAVLTLGLVMISFGGVQTVQADGRINLWHHFGGDALYCTTDEGCQLLNMDGDVLWQVTQAEIDDALSAACATSTPQVIIEAQGTYGPMSLVATCYPGIDNNLELTGYDEHGKSNRMTFSASFAPVGPAVGGSSSGGSISQPGSGDVGPPATDTPASWPLPPPPPPDDDDDGGFTGPGGGG